MNEEKVVVDRTRRDRKAGYTLEEKDAKREQLEKASAEFRKGGRRDPFAGGPGLNTDISKAPDK